MNIERTTPPLKSVLLELPVVLTEKDELEIGRTKAKLERDHAGMLERFADVKREWKKDLDGLQQRIATLGDHLLTGSQPRPVEVVEYYVKEGEHAGKVEQVRADTGEVVERRMADLFEARSSDPKYKAKKGEKPLVAEDDGVTPDLLAEAERAQRDAGVEEDEDGDVVVPETSAKKSPAVKKRKAKSKR